MSLVAARQPRDAPDLTQVPHGRWATVPASPQGDLTPVESGLASPWPGYWVRYKISSPSSGPPEDLRQSHVAVEVRGLSPDDYTVRKFLRTCYIDPDVSEGEKSLLAPDAEIARGTHRWQGPNGGRLALDDSRPPSDPGGRNVYYLFIAVRPGKGVSEIRVRWHGDPDPSKCPLPPPWDGPVPDPAATCTTPPPTVRPLVSRAIGVARVSGTLSSRKAPAEPLPPAEETPVGRPGGGGGGGGGGTSVTPTPLGSLHPVVPPGYGQGQHNAVPATDPETLVGGDGVPYVIDPVTGRRRLAPHTGHRYLDPAVPSEIELVDAACHITVNFTVHANSRVRTYYRTLQVFPASDLVLANPDAPSLPLQAWPSFTPIWRTDAIYEGR